MSTWYGITVDQIDGAAHVSAVFLMNNNIDGVLPASFCNLNNLFALDLSNNNIRGAIPREIVGRNTYFIGLHNNSIDGFPDISDMIAVNIFFEAHLENNRLSFGDLEPNIGYVDHFGYSPQDSICDSARLSIAPGGQLVMKTTTDGTANQYQWVHNESEIPGATDSLLVLSPVAYSDSGRYSCDVTNTVVVGLTLHRRCIEVEVEGGSPSAIDPDNIAPPLQYALMPCVPNPFNPGTTISFELGERGSVHLRVFDVSGRLVKTLVGGEVCESGHHEVVWNGREENGRQCASGTYFYRLSTNGYSETKRMVLVK